MDRGNVQKTQFRLLGIPLFEKRATYGDQTTLRNPKAWLSNILGMNNSAGVPISAETAITLSSVWSAVQILSDTVGMLPANVFKVDGKRKDLAIGHTASRLIRRKPNNVQNSFSWRQHMMACAALWGNGYSRIIRDQNAQPIALSIPYHPKDVQPFIFEGDLWYKINALEVPINQRDIIHIKGFGFNGIEGKSVIATAREAIGVGLAQQQYGGGLFRTGAAKRMALTMPGKLDDKTYERLKNSWNDKYGTYTNMSEVAILEAGIQVAEVGMNAEDAQFLQSRKFGVEEIARYFRIPLHLMQSLDHATNNNIEQQGLDFINYTMMPWLVRFEEEFIDKLFTETEQDLYQVKFNTNAFLRGDLSSRWRYYATMIQWGVLSPNDVREKEDENPRDGGDGYLTPLNMISSKQIADEGLLNTPMQ
jgi:HK97 family phage portal protein